MIGAKQTRCCKFNPSTRVIRSCLNGCLILLCTLHAKGFETLALIKLETPKGQIAMADTSLVKLIKFGLVGVLNTVFGYLVYAALVLLGVIPGIALALAYVIGVAWNYMTHAKLVFKSQRGHGVVGYIGIYVLIYLGNATLLQMAMSAGVSPLLAQAGLAVLFAGISFFAISWVLTGTLPFSELLRRKK